MKTKCMGPKGMGAPVTHDVSSHRALKKWQIWGLWVLMELFKRGLLMNFTCINKLLVFINILMKVGNHKNMQFCLKQAKTFVALNNMI